MSSATVPLLDEYTIPFGEENSLDQHGQKKYTHPYATFFHLFFRILALITYLFCGWFSDSFISSFVSIVLLLSADFWAVKNITGRLLVGLRWWNYIDDDGKSHWVFESKKGTYQQGHINPHEVRIFWLALILCPFFWALFFIIALFGLKFKWLLLVVIALVLSWANLYGYSKCKYGGQKDINTAAKDFVKNQIFTNAFNIMSKASQQPTSAQPTGIV